MNLKEEMLRQVFVQTGGREENPKIVDVCVKIAEKYAAEIVAEVEGSLAAGSCFWQHKWTKWESYRQERFYALLPNAPRYFQLMQKRICVRCNKRQIREVNS